MPSLQRVCAVTLFALLSGCAHQIQIKSAYDQAARFGGWKTYAWAPGTQTGLSDPRLNAAFIDPQVRADVNRELTAKGYVQGTPATADFLVSYHVALADETGIARDSDRAVASAYVAEFQDENPNTVIYGNAMGVSSLDVYQVGTLLLRLTNPQTHKSVWRGTAQARLAENVSRAQRQARLQNAVHLILGKFPPQ